MSANGSENTKDYANVNVFEKIGDNRENVSETLNACDRDRDYDFCVDDVEKQTERVIVNATLPWLTLDGLVRPRITTRREPNSPYMGLAAIGTALLQPTRSTEPPQSNPSNSLSAASASLRFMKATKPLNPELLLLLD